jgi:hypothetical protein
MHMQDRIFYLRQIGYLLLQVVVSTWGGLYFISESIRQEYSTAYESMSCPYDPGCGFAWFGFVRKSGCLWHLNGLKVAGLPLSDMLDSGAVGDMSLIFMGPQPSTMPEFSLVVSRERFLRS